MTQKPKLYVAQRDSLRTHDGHIHAGEAYPAAEVTPSLLGIGWVSEGLGTVPVDPGSHAAFASGELARHEPADPDAVRAWKKAQAEAEVLTRRADVAGTPAAPAPPAPRVRSGIAVPKAKSRRTRTGK